MRLLARTGGITVKTDDEIRAGLKTASQAVLTWGAISYEVPVSSGQLRLLMDTRGYIKTNTFTALMDASGAGKTAVLDVLALRKNIGVITSDIVIDSELLVLRSNVV